MWDDRGLSAEVKRRLGLSSQSVKMPHRVEVPEWNVTIILQLADKIVGAAMCIGQIGNLLPHVVVPAVMPRHLIPRMFSHRGGAVWGVLWRQGSGKVLGSTIHW